MATTTLPARAFDAFLFDVDGTLINSLAPTERNWGAWALRHGIDPATFLPTIHGVRAVDMIARHARPGSDLQAELAWINDAELADMDGVHEIGGAARFLRALPPERWAIVTSATPDLVRRRLAAAGLPLPAVLVTSADVENGKPAPDCFLLAAARLGFPAADCLVFEDAPAGIAAGEAAGAEVLVVTATHAYSAGHTQARPAIRGYDALGVEATADGRLRLVARAPVAVEA